MFTKQMALLKKKNGKQENDIKRFQKTPKATYTF